MELNVHFVTNDVDERYTCDDVESAFYKAIGERLGGISVPNEIKVTVEEYPDAQILYEVSERGTFKKAGITYPSMYVIETDDTIYERLEPSFDYKHVFLTCVNPESNNYKYYEIIPSEEDFFTVNYGRMNEDLMTFSPSGRTTQDPYDSRLYWIRYYEKISKGYIDNTHIYVSGNGNRTLRRKKGETVSAQKTYTNIEDKLYNELLNYSKKVVEDNLLITKMMKTQLDRCNELYYELSATKSLEAFNEKLKEMYSICPRRMSKVADNMATNAASQKSILDHEWRLLSSMNAVFGINQNEAVKEVEEPQHNPFKDFGVELYSATYEQREHIMEHLYDELKQQVRNVYRVIPLKQKERFDNYLKRNNITVVKELWHGSRNENWLSIVEKSLLLYPDAIITGKMFGDGIYFASNIYKSLNYTSLKGSSWAGGNSRKGYMGLFATAYGEPLFAESSHCYSASEIAAEGKNCVHAQAGTYLINDEIIFYDEDAVLLNYIVEFEAE